MANNLLKNHFTQAIIQRIRKIKLANKYRTYVRKKNKMIKAKHHRLYNY